MHVGHLYAILELAEQTPPLVSEVDVADKVRDLERSVFSLQHGARGLDIRTDAVRKKELQRAIFQINERTIALLSALGLSDYDNYLLLSITQGATHTNPPNGTIEQEFAQALREIQLPRVVDVLMPVPLVLYVKDGDHLAARQAIIDLAEEYGQAEEFPPLEGSYFQRFRIWTKRQGAQELGDAMRRAAQLPLEEQQANVNVLQAEAVSKLISALENTETAAGLVGSVLVIKVNGMLNFRTLTNREIIYLGKHPGLIRDPASMQVALDALPIDGDDPCGGCRHET